jgi:uncharacterized membrane protein
MSHKPRISGAALAAATALLFVSGAVHAGDEAKGAEEAKVKCYGVNACKGQSACAGAKNACQGQNSCKGTGYVVTNKADCEAKEGEIRS